MPGLDDGFDLKQLVSVPTEKIPIALAALAAAQSQLCARLMGVAPASESAPGLIDAPELARRLSLPESWIRTQARTGGIPTVRAGRYYRFNEQAVAAALADRGKP